MIRSSTSAFNQIASLNIGLDKIAFVLKKPSISLTPSVGAISILSDSQD
jgi:hypothetical protein